MMGCFFFLVDFRISTAWTGLFCYTEIEDWNEYKLGKDTVGGKARVAPSAAELMHVADSYAGTFGPLFTMYDVPTSALTTRQRTGMGQLKCDKLILPLLSDAAVT